MTIASTPPSIPGHQGSINAHINLLGWASMDLTGLLYRSFPAVAESRLALWHYWLSQIGVLVTLLAIAALYSGGCGSGRRFRLGGISNRIAR